MSQQNKPKPKSFARRDELMQLEEAAQRKWQELKIHELDAPEDGQGEKFMATFPYPYMNGKMHLGHAFTLTKAEFATAYQRLKGKRVLLPFGFHCTGMPISAAAQKLKREIEEYGNPPNFDRPAPETVATTSQESSADPTKFKTKKSKVAAKTGGIVRQWTILKSMGLTDEEIPDFVNPLHWLRYFPPLAKEDLQRFGLHVDFRRSFITTDLNPYYDSFIRWQFETLKSLDKLSFGKRYTIFSPMDNQPCADHDRAEGEGAGPQEYTLIKMKVIAPFPEVLKPLEGKNVFLAAATLRPETMYGQTNCWVLPEGEYGAFEINDDDVYIITERAALNLSYQNFSKVVGRPNCLLRLTGQDILGLPLSAPNTAYEVIYTLPMLTISTMKGTGIVTSVPSDAPDDYAALMDLKNKPALRAKYGIKDEWVLPFECVPIIELTFDDGVKTNLSAPKICHDLKIMSQNDRDKLAVAKDAVYLKGFYDGVLLVGPHAGKRIFDVKTAVKQEMIDAGGAIIYSEPDKVVISRSGDECVVALCDQWYLKYGEEPWKSQVSTCLSRMETFNPATKKAFEETIAWLKEWACSRNFGLGSHLPWDPSYLIESLSDSTIYMAYYTVAHLLQGGSLEGAEAGPAGIRPEQLTNQVWDYIFRSGPLPENTDIPEATLKKLRNEFTYWYPVDLRVSGKDLINNHLTMFLYNHTAMFPEEHWPRGIFTNGHIAVNNEKMSKSKGNFFTLKEIIEMYTADCARLACANAGDGMDDANFVEDTANNAILRLTTQLAWIKDVLADREPTRSGPADLFADRVFENEINLAIRLADASFSRMKFSEALKIAFFDFQNARDTYKTECGKNLMNRDLVMRFIEVQNVLLSVFCPHYCEHIWEILGKEGTVINARWPESGEVDYLLKQSHDYLQESIHTFRQKLDKDKAARAKKNGKVPNEAYIYVADNYADWQLAAVRIVRDAYNAKGAFPEDIAATLKKDATLAKDMKKMMPFIGFLKEEVARIGAAALADNLPFNEKQLMRDNIELVAAGLGLNKATVYGSSDAEIVDPATRMVMAMPGKPQVYFFSTEDPAPVVKTPAASTSVSSTSA